MPPVCAPFLCPLSLLRPCAAAAAAGNAASSRWASKLQQLQQQPAAPAEAAASAADAAAGSESDSDAAFAQADAFTSGSSSSGSAAPRQLREVQMPALCSVRQLAVLLDTTLQQLEVVLKEQLGEEIKSGAGPAAAVVCGVGLVWCVAVHLSVPPGTVGVAQQETVVVRGMVGYLTYLHCMCKRWPCQHLCLIVVYVCSALKHPPCSLPPSLVDCCCCCRGGPGVTRVC